MRAILTLLLISSSIALVSCASNNDDGSPTEFAPRTLSVLVGGGMGTSSLNEYFPRAIEIRAGDTVRWQVNGNADDPHTVTFSPNLDAVVDIVPKPNGGRDEFIFATSLADPSRGRGAPIESYRPSGYFNSGIMFGYQLSDEIPLIEEFSLRFPEPGSFNYICGIHEFHRGTVIVKEASDPNLPHQVEISQAATEQMKFGLGITNALQEFVRLNQVLDREPKTDGSERIFVAAGMGSPEAEVLEFFPKKLEIKVGDTVTWFASRFHAVVLNTEGSPPEFYLTEPRAGPTPFIVANPKVLFPTEPTPEFDGTGGLWSSGLLGYGQRPGGLSYTLTFTTPGTYGYVCPIHRGMVGTVSVN